MLAGQEQIRGPDSVKITAKSKPDAYPLPIIKEGTDCVCSKVR